MAGEMMTGDPSEYIEELANYDFELHNAGATIRAMYALCHDKLNEQQKKNVTKQLDTIDTMTKEYF